MGRAFEFRKERKFKRWGAMAKAFTRIGKDISIAVKAGGGDPDTNARLRTCIQNAKAVNMPKDRVENAIKRATSKDTAGYEELTYEGYGAHGVAIVIDTATDNPTRTIANLRAICNKYGGTIGTQGSVEYMFKKKAFFKFNKGNWNLEELELELIDGGLLSESTGFGIGARLEVLEVETDRELGRGRALKTASGQSQKRHGHQGHHQGFRSTHVLLHPFS